MNTQAKSSCFCRLWAGNIYSAKQELFIYINVQILKLSGFALEMHAGPVMRGDMCKAEVERWE